MSATELTVDVVVFLSLHSVLYYHHLRTFATSPVLHAILSVFTLEVRVFTFVRYSSQVAIDVYLNLLKFTCIHIPPLLSF